MMEIQRWLFWGSGHDGGVLPPLAAGPLEFSIELTRFPVHGVFAIPSPGIGAGTETRVQTRGRVDGVAEDPLELMDAAVAAALGSHPVEVFHHGRVLEQGRQPPVAVPAGITEADGAGCTFQEVLTLCGPMGSRQSAAPGFLPVRQIVGVNADGSSAQPQADRRCWREASGTARSCCAVRWSYWLRRGSCSRGASGDLRFMLVTTLPAGQAAAF